MSSPPGPSFNYDADKGELIIVEEKKGDEIRHTISNGSWIISTMCGNSYYPVLDTYFDTRYIKLNDRYIKLNDRFGKKG